MQDNWNSLMARISGIGYVHIFYFVIHSLVDSFAGSIKKSCKNVHYSQ